MEEIKLNLGCGLRKMDGYVNIDNRESMNPDLCVDVTNGLPFESCTVDEVRAFDFLEHIQIGKVVPLIEEIYRVLKPGGKFVSLTPSTDGRGAFQDPTHVSFWNKNSWYYYSADDCRKLYGITAKFKGTVQDLKSVDDESIIHTYADLVKD